MRKIVKAKITKKASKTTFKHVGILARRYRVSNLVMLNSILIGGFRDELAELIGA